MTKNYNELDYFCAILKNGISRFLDLHEKNSTLYYTFIHSCHCSDNWNRTITSKNSQ